MKIGDAASRIRTQLDGIYDQGEADAIANMLLEHITGVRGTARLLNTVNDLAPAQAEQLDELLLQLRKHRPVQYVLQTAWFFDMPLYVDERVLIPRPETEELVDWVIRDVRASGRQVFVKGEKEADETTQLKILDVGTGSGCIALALKKNMPLAEVWGCDTSDEALTVARRNGSTLDIRVDFQGVDFLDPAQQKSLPTVDIVVSNPPYIPSGESSTMQPNVVRYEPHTALFVPDNDPLVFYRALATFGKHRLHDGGALYMEIHESVANDVQQLFRNEGYRSIEIRKDMQGKERMVKVRA